MEVAYCRVNKNSQEWVNGCPSILFQSEPAMVIVKHVNDGLIRYYHFKHNKEILSWKKFKW